MTSNFRVVDECPTLAEVIGSNLRRVRGERGWLQDDVARRVRAVGVPWSPPVVAAIEAGTREIHFAELVLAVAALDIDLADLFAGDGRARVVGDVAVELSTFWTAVQSREGGRELIQAVRDQRRRVEGSLEADLAERGLIGEAEYRAGRQLSVTPEVVVQYSLRLYDRVLSQERDARVRAKYGAELAARSLQAARGHVMRSLLTELAEVITQDQEQADYDRLSRPDGDDEHGGGA